MKHKKNTSKTSTGKKGGMSKIVPGAAGVLVGAAIGGAAAVALSDAKTRKKVGEKINDLTDLAANALDSTTEATQIPSQTKKIKK